MVQEADRPEDTRAELARKQLIDFFQTQEEKYPKEEGWFTIRDLADMKGITYRVAETLVHNRLDAGELEVVRDNRMKYYRIRSD